MVALTTPTEMPNPHPHQELIDRSNASKARLLESLHQPVTPTQCVIDKKDVEEVIGIMGKVNELLTQAVFTPNHDVNIIPASAQFWHNAGLNAETVFQQSFCHKEAYNNLVNHLYGMHDAAQL